MQIHDTGNRGGVRHVLYARRYVDGGIKLRRRMDFDGKKYCHASMILAAEEVHALRAWLATLPGADSV